MIEVQHQYGCLTVLDNGENYRQSKTYIECLKEKRSIEEENLSYQNISDSEVKKAIINRMPNSSFFVDLSKNPSDINMIYDSFVDSSIYRNNKKLEKIAKQTQTHYKCQCKCGRIHYYNEKTIESNPKYCFYPVLVSTKTNSRAYSSAYVKEKEYEDIECVVLCDKSECKPAKRFCEYYNKYKIKQIEKIEEKKAEKRAKLPRIFADNYEVDYTGRQYESLYIERCCNEHLESEFSSNTIKVYKQYRCRCTVCGKVILVKCDDFGIYPPTEYGVTAYNGYWSKISCNCHPISSFQWIVCKILFEANVNYKVEYSFPDLKGEKDRLRFDFAIFDSNGSLQCLIECQGEQHDRPIKKFGWINKFDIQVEYDELKRRYCENNNINLIEISYRNKKYEKIKSILKQNGVLQDHVVST